MTPSTSFVPLELPYGNYPARETPAETGVAEQFARVSRMSVFSEVGRSGGGGEPLDARPDRHRDHVLLQTFVIAYSGVASGG